MLDEENDSLRGSACRVIMSHLILNEKREAKIMRQQKRQVTDKATICAMLDEMDAKPEPAADGLSSGGAAAEQPTPGDSASGDPASGEPPADGTVSDESVRIP